ncbi:MAG: CoA-binding protein [Gemmatimonadaceae bacterium]|nr:CoA-binding protein [Gemmatimonadaceae bacterium]
METAHDVLRRARAIGVVGLDSRVNRPAYEIASYLKEHGYRIIPIHRGRHPADEILGERAYESLRDVPGHVDLVDVFVRSDQTDPVIDDAIAIGADCVWLQVGITNDAGLARASKAGLATIQDHCAMVEHKAMAAGADG